MYQIKVYRGKRSRIAKVGNFQDCINWMCRPINLNSQLTGWELMRAPLCPVLVDMSKITLFGSITNYGNR